MFKAWIASFVFLVFVCFETEASIALAPATVPLPPIPQEIAELCVKVEVHHYDDAFTGSGTVVAEENGRYLILTCDHVLGTNPFAPIVKFVDKTPVCAEFVATDPSVDIGALSIKSSVKNLKVKGLFEKEEQDRKLCWQSGFPDIGEGKQIKRQGLIVAKGLVSAALHPRFQQEVFRYSMASSPGDSGSGVLTYPQGKLVGIVWGGNGVTADVTGIKDIKYFCRTKCAKDFPKFAASLSPSDKQP